MLVADTTFGLDISSHQAGLDVGEAAKQGFDFLTTKLTEGTGYVNPYYDGHRGQAEKAGMLFADYHALHHGNAVAQANYHCRFKRDKSIPTMIDFEPFGDNPTRFDAVKFKTVCRLRGVKVTQTYHPHWYWQQIGSPTLKGLGAIISSAYPSNAHVYASAGYNAVGGDTGVGWAPYGGLTPLIWQFTSSGKLDGWANGLDFDAFKGTRQELAATGLFKDYAPTPPPAPKPARTLPGLARARALLRGVAKFHPKLRAKIAAVLRAARGVK